VRTQSLTTSAFTLQYQNLKLLFCRASVKSVRCVWPWLSSP
jgi:hypothetical protein